MADRKKWKGEGSHLRSRSNETTDKAEACARRAWQCLALAGAPRVVRTARDKYVAEAASLFDSARPMWREDGTRLDPDAPCQRIRRCEGRYCLNGRHTEERRAGAS